MKRNNRFNKRSAFSLIEISMVITIIAILVGIIIVAGGKIVLNARIAAARSLTASSPVNKFSDLVLWLDATAKDSFITTEITSSTKAISTWYDLNKQFNYQNNATQAVSANQPIYTSNVINGLPAVKFGNNTSDGMIIANTLNLTDNYTVFIVFNTIGTSAARSAIQGQSVNWLIGPYNNIISHYAGGWVSNTASALTSGKFYLATAVRNTVSAFYINGVYIVNGAGNITSPGSLALGASGSVTSQPLNGYIAEVIVYSRDLSNTDRQDVENYLIQKWNIS